jgi:hypothetical protein
MRMPNLARHNLPFFESKLVEENMRTPAGLQAQGKALCKKITGEFTLENEPDRLELLFQACKTADQIAELDEAAAEAPLTVKGSMGQPVISPFIAEARVQRGLLAQLLDRMNFEETDG